MAAGLPVVSTSLGIEGIRAKDGVNALIRDSKEELVQATVELLNNPELARKLAINGKRLVIITLIGRKYPGILTWYTRNWGIFMKIKLSVNILNYNTAGLLKSCLSAVLASKGFEARELEVIVVDNNSSDNSVEMVRKDYPDVKLVRNRKNLGFSAGNNVGIKVARGNFLLLLNTDTLVEPDALVTVLNAMENDRSIGAATCLLQTADGKIDPASHRGFPTPWNSFSYF